MSIQIYTIQSESFLSCLGNWVRSEQEKCEETTENAKAEKSGNRSQLLHPSSFNCPQSLPQLHWIRLKSSSSIRAEEKHQGFAKTQQTSHQSGALNSTNRSKLAQGKEQGGEAHPKWIWRCSGEDKRTTNGKDRNYGFCCFPPFALHCLII